MGKREVIAIFAMLALSACHKNEAPLAVATEPRPAEEMELNPDKLLAKASLKKPLHKLYIRAFKQEGELELWGANKDSNIYTLIATYPIAGQSGILGPKRKEGDRQVPEGYYTVDRFNPNSRFHLSLGIDYPNASDRVLSDKEKPGSDIFIHGSNVSIGCLAMTDPVIETIYELASQAKPRGIPVHIYPFRMTEKNLAKFEADHPNLKNFWRNLLPGYEHFESTKTPAKPSVKSRTGRYIWNP